MAQSDQIRSQTSVSRDAQRLLAEYFRIRREYNSLNRNDPAHAPRRDELRERYFMLDRQYTQLINANAAVPKGPAKSRADVLWEGAFGEENAGGTRNGGEAQWIELNTPTEGRETDEIFEEALRQAGAPPVVAETELALDLEPPHEPDFAEAPTEDAVTEGSLAGMSEDAADERTPAPESLESLGNLDHPNLSAVSALREIAEGLQADERFEPVIEEDASLETESVAPETPVEHAAARAVPEPRSIPGPKPEPVPQTRIAHARGDFGLSKRASKKGAKEIACPVCGERVPAGTHVCTFCQARLIGAPDAESVRNITQTNLQPPKPYEKPGIGPKVIITLGWLPVLAGAAWLIVRAAGVNREEIDAWLQSAHLGFFADPQAGGIFGISMVVLGMAIVGLGVFAGRFVRFVIPMHELARSGRIDMIEKLILQGEDIDVRDDHGCTPLHFAIVAGQREAAAVLVGNGADPNSHNDRGDTPLHLATANHDHALVQYLLSKGADAEALNDSGSSLMHVAAWVGDVSLLRTFLERGLSIEARTKVGFTPLHFAAQSGFDDATAFLLERGAQVNSASNLGTTPLFGAVRNGHLPVVQRLVDAGADVNIHRGRDSESPLSIAIEHKRAEIVELLKARGATEG